jgi:hypothetical protein
MGKKTKLGGLGLMVVWSIAAFVAYLLVGLVRIMLTKFLLKRGVKKATKRGIKQVTR